MSKKSESISDLNFIHSTRTAPHFLWGDNCDGWWLKKNGRFTVISETMPRGTAEIKHFHDKTEQFFYVLVGKLDIEVDDVNYHLQRHECLTIKARSVHKVCNKSDQNVTFLVVSCPDSHEDRVNMDE